MTRLIRLVVIVTALLVMPLAPQDIQVNPETIDCLAKGIYFESGNQSKLGKQAVAWVIFNRSKDWNLSICGVVHQKVGKNCQFIWYCDSTNNTKINKRMWEESRNVAIDMLNHSQDYRDFTNGAKFFHAKYVKPSWRTKRKFTIKVGDHLFYQ